jgi:GGDEF domain-containing protein
MHYNELPLDKRVERKAGTPSEQRFIDYLHTQMQAIFQSTLAAEGFIRQIAKDQVRQQAHFTQYFKNRLHQQLGLRHQLTFDPYTGLLSNATLEANLDVLMNAFFHHCTLDRMLTHLQEGINRSLLDPTAGIMTPLNTLIDQALQEGTLGRDKEALLVYDDDANCVTVTKKGVVGVLLQLGYITMPRNSKEK